MELQTSTNLLCKYKTDLENLIESPYELDSKYFTGKRSFKNSKKLTFQATVKLLLTPLISSLSLILFRCPKLVSGASKSAFVQARGKINPLFFRYMNEKIIGVLGCFYKGDGRYKGYRVYGGDGTTIHLPQTKACMKEFRAVKNQHVERCLAQAVLLVDLVTGHIVKMVTSSYGDSERHMFFNLLFPELPIKSICVLDRLYPSAEFFYEFERRGLLYIMRCKKKFNKEVRAFEERGGTDEIVDMSISHSSLTSLKKKYQVTCKDKIRVRFIRIFIEGKVDYTLVTNILDSSLDLNDFAKLYQMRWRVETVIDYLKNKLQLENFSGHKVEHVKQDLEAIPCKYNAVLGLYQIAQNELDKIHKDKSEKRRINMTLAVHVFADLMKSEVQSIEELRLLCGYSLYHLIRNPEIIREGRSNPRNKQVRNGRGRCRYDPNFKQCA
jgi:hypothetical protein